MALDPSILRAMQTAGASIDIIIAAVEADATLQDAKVAERRAKDAERQRRHRMSRDVTVTNGDGADVTDQVSFDKETTPRPPKKLNPSHVCETRAKGWHRLPDDWEPRPLPLPVQAKSDLWPPGSLDDELADFRRWAANAENKNGKGRKLDWDQAWRNWIGRRHNERYSRDQTSRRVSPNGMGRHQSPDGLSPTTRAALAVFGSGHERPIPQ